jgi:hypothetical protein
VGALVFNTFLAVVFAGAIIETFKWREEVAVFPRIAACVGLVMVASQLVIDLRNRRRAHQVVSASTAAEDDADAAVVIGRRGALWLFAGLMCVVLLGVPVGMPLFVVLLCRYGFDEGWLLSIGVAATDAFLLVVVFGRVFGAVWGDPLLLTLLTG